MTGPDQAKSITEELVRGEILLYLRRIYPEGATPRTLRHYLQERAYTVAEEEFNFDVAYLGEAGLVTCDMYPQDLGEARKLRLVKITKAGIDEVDKRPKGSGVRF